MVSKKPPPKISSPTGESFLRPRRSCRASATATHATEHPVVADIAAMVPAAAPLQRKLSPTERRQQLHLPLLLPLLPLQRTQQRLMHPHPLVVMGRRQLSALLIRHLQSLAVMARRKLGRRKKFRHMRSLAVMGRRKQMRLLAQHRQSVRAAL